MADGLLVSSSDGGSAITRSDASGDTNRLDRQIEAKERLLEVARGIDLVTGVC